MAERDGPPGEEVPGGGDLESVPPQELSGGTNEAVMGIREPQTVVASSAIACFDELDEVSPEVTVQDLVTEKLRWNSPWYRSIPPVRDEDVLLKPLLSRAVVSGLGVYRTVFASYWPVLLVGILSGRGAVRGRSLLGWSEDEPPRRRSLLHDADGRRLPRHHRRIAERVCASSPARPAVHDGAPMSTRGGLMR